MSKKKSKKVVKKAVKKAKPVKKVLKKPAKILKSKPLKKSAKILKIKEKSEPKKAKLAHTILKTQVAAKDAFIEEVQEEVILTNAEGKRYCRSTDCDEAAVIDSYCRLHYIMYWKRNKNKIKILEDGKLDKYIEELTQRYPDKYLEILKKDLLTEKEFTGVITEMDQNDQDEAESEDDNRFVEEIRGGVPTSDDDDF